MSELGSIAAWSADLLEASVRHGLEPSHLDSLVMITRAPACCRQPPCAGSEIACSYGMVAVPAELVVLSVDARLVPEKGPRLVEGRAPRNRLTSGALTLGVSRGS